MSVNRVFGRPDLTENQWAARLDQDLAQHSEPIFQSIWVEDAWDDLNVAPFSASLGPSIRPPVITKIKDDGSGSEGIYVYAFEEGKSQEIFFTCQIPHTYKIGSDLKPHVHIMLPTSGTGKYVDMGLEFTWCNIGDVMAANSLVISAPLAANDTAFKHHIHSLGTISGSGKNISSILTCRLFRKNVAVNSYTGNVYLLSVDFHHQIDSLGSRQELIK